MTEEVNLDEVMSRRFELVEEQAIIAGRHKAELQPLADELKLCEDFIRTEMLKGGMQQCKTTAGMAFFTTKSSCAVRDWEATLACIRDNGLWHLLNRAVSKEAVKEYIEEHKEAPPGVEFTAFKDISWRKGK